MPALGSQDKASTDKKCSGSQMTQPLFCSPSLALLWYALYAWDKSLGMMYAHICWLVSSSISTFIPCLTYIHPRIPCHQDR